MKSTSWLVFIILTFLKASSAENSTLVYYVELQIEKSTLSNLTDLLGKLQVVNVKAQNAAVTNITKTTECTSMNCTCEEKYTWSDKVCTNYPNCCPQNNSCKITSLHTYDLCIPKKRVTCSGSFTIESLFYGNKSFNELTPGDFIVKMEQFYSTIMWFNSLNVTSLKQGSIIGYFVVQFDDTINGTLLEMKTDNLGSEMKATFNLVTTGLINISRLPQDIVNSFSKATVTCTPLVTLGNAKWFILNGVQKREVTNGSESRVHQFPKYSSVEIINTSEFWKGTFICDYISSNSNSITHRASIDLDIAILPEIFITSEPQFPHCDVKNEDSKKIKVLCIIQNSSEIYTFTPTPYTTSSTKDKIAFTFEININCSTGMNIATCEFTNRGHQTIKTSLNITIIYTGDNFCTEDTIWPDAKVNFSAKLLCPQSGFNIMERKCFENGTYGPVTSDCVDQELYDLWNNAKDIQRGIGSITCEAFNVFSDLKKSTEKVQSFSTIDAFTRINTSVDVMHLMQDASRLQNSLWNDSVLPNILRSSSNLMNDSLLDKWKNTELAVKYLVSLENILQQTNITSEQSNCQENNVKIIATFLQNSSAQPDEQCKTEQNINIKNSSSNILFQTVIKNLDQLLPSNNNWNSTGLIFSVVAKNTNKQSISINWELKRPRNHEIMCVYFDTDIKQWSNNSCTWDYDLNICTCKHLSAFTIMMSKYPVKLLYMEEITYIGLAFSIASLALCLLIELVVWNTVVKSNISHFKHTVLVNIIFSLLIAHCCFLAGTPKEQKQWCLALTVLKHFFFLAVFFWMMCFSMGLLHQLTFYFVQLRKKVYLWLCFSFGYACPLLIVIVTVITYNNGAVDSYYVIETCWLKYESPLHGSIHFFVVPVGMIVLLNMFTMVVVISKLLKPTMTDGTTHDEKEIVRGIIKTIVLLTPVLGTTWILGFFIMILDLTYRPYAQIINYAFTFFNSLQGFFILLTGFCADKKVRNVLLTHLRQKHVARNRGEISTTMTAAKKK